jgi:hypothetical protein
MFTTLASPTIGKQGGRVLGERIDAAIFLLLFETDAPNI